MDSTTNSIDANAIRRRVAEAPDTSIESLADEIRRALEGDSNDAEHDALVSVAGFLGIDYEPFDG